MLKLALLLCPLGMAVAQPTEKPVVLYRGLGTWQHPIATGNPEGFSHVNEVPRPLLDRLELIYMGLPDEKISKTLTCQRCIKQAISGLIRIVCLALMDRMCLAYSSNRHQEKGLWHKLPTKAGPVAA